MLSILSRSVLRSAVSVNVLATATSKRFFKSPFASEEEPDEANCPKAKAFDDLMDKKSKEKKPSKMDASQLKDDDYPFDLEEEDYVVMVDPKTGEWNPPRGVFNGAEPTRYGDWEIKGRCYDF